MHHSICEICSTTVCTWVFVCTVLNSSTRLNSYLYIVNNRRTTITHSSMEPHSSHDNVELELDVLLAEPDVSGPSMTYSLTSNSSLVRLTDTDTDTDTAGGDIKHELYVDATDGDSLPLLADKNNSNSTHASFTNIQYNSQDIPIEDVDYEPNMLHQLFGWKLPLSHFHIIHNASDSRSFLSSGDTSHIQQQCASLGLPRDLQHVVALGNSFELFESRAAASESESDSKHIIVKQHRLLSLSSIAQSGLPLPLSLHPSIRAVTHIGESTAAFEIQKGLAQLQKLVADHSKRHLSYLRSLILLRILSPWILIQIMLFVVAYVTTYMTSSGLVRLLLFILYVVLFVLCVYVFTQSDTHRLEWSRKQQNIFRTEVLPNALRQLNSSLAPNCFRFNVLHSHIDAHPPPSIPEFTEWKQSHRRSSSAWFNRVHRRSGTSAVHSTQTHSDQRLPSRGRTHLHHQNGSSVSHSHDTVSSTSDSAAASSLSDRGVFTGVKLQVEYLHGRPLPAYTVQLAPYETMFPSICSTSPCAFFSSAACNAVNSHFGHEIFDTNIPCVSTFLDQVNDGVSKLASRRRFLWMPCNSLLQLIGGAIVTIAPLLLAFAVIVIPGTGIWIALGCFMSMLCLIVAVASSPIASTNEVRSSYLHAVRRTFQAAVLSNVPFQEHLQQAGIKLDLFFSLRWRMHAAAFGSSFERVDWLVPCLRLSSIP
jgi:hypothetical protein